MTLFPSHESPSHEFIKICINNTITITTTNTYTNHKKINKIKTNRMESERSNDAQVRADIGCVRGGNMGM